MKINRFETSCDLYDTLEEKLRQKIKSSETFNLAISGGSTPIPLFEKFGKNMLPCASNNSNLLWVDERFVPKSDQRNNYSVASKNWLNTQKGWNIYPMITESISLEESVLHYQNVVKKVGALDVVLLGMGEDGHIASIFPSTENSDSDVLSSIHPFDGTQRISLGYKTLFNAHEVWLIIKGRTKMEVLECENNLPIHHLIKSKEVTVYYSE